LKNVLPLGAARRRGAAPSACQVAFAVRLDAVGVVTDEQEAARRGAKTASSLLYMVHRVPVPQDDGEITLL